MFTLVFTSLLLLCTSGLAASPPIANPHYILDPLNSPQHGAVFSANHIVLKVDCPGCPVFNKEWSAKGTSLIFDFTLSADPQDLTKPFIQLNGDQFFPKGRELGWTGFTDHTGRPVPYTTSLEDYLAKPNAYSDTDLVGVVEPLAVNNTYGWNLTAVLFLTVAYGNDRNTSYENFGGNISAIELFYRTTPFWSETRDRKGNVIGGGTREHWTLEWWQIVPFPLLWNRTVATEPPSMRIPDALQYKLLGRVPATEGCGTTSCDAVQPALQDLLGWVHFLGAIVIIVIIVGVFTGVWWYFGEEIRKLKVWEDLRKWWDERMKKDEADGGENAPLLAGGDDHEG